jgi:hypothetical protein
VGRVNEELPLNELFRSSVDLNLVPDVGAHEVFAHSTGPERVFRVRYKLRSVERHGMRVDSQLRPRLAEDRSGLLRSCVVIDDSRFLFRGVRLGHGRSRERTLAR